MLSLHTTLPCCVCLVQHTPAQAVITPRLQDIELLSQYFSSTCQGNEFPFVGPVSHMTISSDASSVMAAIASAEQPAAAEQKLKLLCGDAGIIDLRGSFSLGTEGPPVEPYITAASMSSLSPKAPMDAMAMERAVLLLNHEFAGSGSIAILPPHHLLDETDRARCRWTPTNPTLRSAARVVEDLPRSLATTDKPTEVTLSLASAVLSLSQQKQHNRSLCQAWQLSLSCFNPLQVWMPILNIEHWVLGYLGHDSSNTDRKPMALGIWDPATGWSSSHPRDCPLSGCVFKHGMAAMRLSDAPDDVLSDTLCNTVAEQATASAYEQQGGVCCGIYVVMMALLAMSAARKEHTHLRFSGDTGAARGWLAASMVEGRLLLPSALAPQAAPALQAPALAQQA